MEELKGRSGHKKKVQYFIGVLKINIKKKKTWTFLCENISIILLMSCRVRRIKFILQLLPCHFFNNINFLSDFLNINRIKWRPTTVIVVIRIRYAKECGVTVGGGLVAEKNIYSCRDEILYTTLYLRYYSMLYYPFQYFYI